MIQGPAAMAARRSGSPLPPGLLQCPCAGLEGVLCEIPA